MVHSLATLGVTEDEYEPYLGAELLALRGWAGIVRQIEERPDRVPARDLTVTLRGYLAVRLLFERAALDHAARQDLDQARVQLAHAGFVQHGLGIQQVGDLGDALLEAILEDGERALGLLRALGRHVQPRGRFGDVLPGRADLELDLLPLGPLGLGGGGMLEPAGGDVRARAAPLAVRHVQPELEDRRDREEAGAIAVPPLRVGEALAMVPDRAAIVEDRDAGLADAERRRERDTQLRRRRGDAVADETPRPEAAHR